MSGHACVPSVLLIARSWLSVGSAASSLSDTARETARRDPKLEDRGLLTAVDRYEVKYGSLLRTGNKRLPTVGIWVWPQGPRWVPRRQRMWAPLYPSDQRLSAHFDATLMHGSAEMRALTGCH
jgi:hypothetical protein